MLQTIDLSNLLILVVSFVLLHVLPQKTPNHLIFVFLCTTNDMEQLQQNRLSKQMPYHRILTGRICFHVQIISEVVKSLS